MSSLQIGNGFPINSKSELASWVAVVLKNLSANAGDVRDSGLIPGLGRSPGGGHGNPLQYSCLENPIDRGAWWAAFHGVAKSQTRLKQLSIHAAQSVLPTTESVEYTEAACRAPSRTLVFFRPYSPA